MLGSSFHLNFSVMCMYVVITHTLYSTDFLRYLLNLLISYSLTWYFNLKSGRLFGLAHITYYLQNSFICSDSSGLRFDIYFFIKFTLTQLSFSIFDYVFFYIFKV